MDIGTVAMDVPSRRTAYQLNSRVDYQTASAQDRFYGTYWRTRVDSPYPDIRPTFDFAQQTGADFISAAHTHSFGTNKLNEVRFSTFSQPWLNEFKDRNIYSLPCIVTNDGISFPSSSTGSGD